jgi:hypothetical protein
MFEAPDTSMAGGGVPELVPPRDNPGANPLAGRSEPAGAGSTDLSQKVIEARLASDKPASTRNYAIVEYRDDTGALRTHIEVSSSSQGHAEQLIDQWLRQHNISPSNVTRLYCEREPCEKGCADLVSKYPNAKVTYTVPYYGGPAARAAMKSDTLFQRYLQSILGGKGK